MSRDVTPNFKQPKPEAPVRTEQQERGKRNRDAGHRFQRKVRKVIEVLTGCVANRFRSATAHEENWYGLPWRVECKYALKNHPVVTAYEKAREQAERNNAIGNLKPFVFACGNARSGVLFVIAADDLVNVADTVVSRD